jgi:hypothetical protein
MDCYAREEEQLKMNDSKEPEPDKVPEHNSTSKDGTAAASREDPPSYAEWRQLAQRIQQETDPERLFVLVRQLITLFDDEQLRNCLRRPPEEK